METVRASGRVPGEHTVGQRRLTVQLAVGKQLKVVPFLTRRELLWEIMTSLRHDAVMRFTSRSRQRRFEHSIRCCGLRGRKPRIPRDVGDGCQVRRDSVTRA